VREFIEILPEFSTNQNFWGCACTPASYTTGSEKFWKKSPAQLFDTKAARV